jgi:hypothetical protein
MRIRIWCDVQQIFDMTLICSVLEMVRSLVGGSLDKIHAQSEGELQSTTYTKVNKNSMCNKIWIG